LSLLRSSDDRAQDPNVPFSCQSNRVMAALAANLTRRAKASREQHVHTGSRKEPVSFHLAFLLGNDFELPEGKTSVDVLRMPFNYSVHAEEASDPSQWSKCFGINRQLFRGKSTNPSGTRMELWTKKINTSNSNCEVFDKAWQDRLLIITERRIFIVTKKFNVTGEQKRRTSIDLADREGAAGTADLEIVDSIPVEEIAAISIERSPGVFDDEVSRAGASLLTMAVRRARRAASLLSFDRSFLDDGGPSMTEEGRTAERLTMEQTLLRRAVPSPLDGFCEPILRISTQPEGFNRGQSYYFLLRAQDFPCLDDGGPVPLRTRHDADALAARLAAATARRIGEHARETRFLRLQVRPAI
jgi:hypothetical protein